MKKKTARREREVVLVSDTVAYPFRCEKPIYRVGIALSGGGGRGFAHAGVLQAMEDLGLKPDIVAGTSAGAIAGAMYASGISPEHMLALFGSIRFFQFPHFRIFERDDSTDSVPDIHSSYILLKSRDLEKIIAESLPVHRFEELKVPLVVNATNMMSGVNTYFTHGDLVKPVVASSSIPVFFKPVEINGIEYVDGGVMQNLPVTAIRNACEYVIAVDVNPIEDYSKEGKLQERGVERVFRLMIRANTLNERSEADVYILPTDLVHFSIFDTKHGKEMFEIGYNSAKPILEEFIKAHPELVQKKVR